MHPCTHINVPLKRKYREIGEILPLAALEIVRQLDAPKVEGMTTFGAANDGNFVNMTIAVYVYVPSSTKVIWYVALNPDSDAISSEWK